MIAVLGLGFVGLTTALGFAEKGHKVLGLDVNAGHVDKLKSGEVPFHEPGVPEALTRHLGKNFDLTSAPDERLSECEAIFICVGTPSADDGKADLGYIRDAVQSVHPYLVTGSFKTIIIKSTVPPGSTDNQIRGFVTEIGLDVGVGVGLANNPEFLREGVAWKDFIYPDRIVVGVSDDKTAALMGELYAAFDCEIHAVSLNEAEFIKYASNTFLATAISFANEMSMIAHEIGGIEIPRAFKILHQDGRWSGDPCSMKNYVYPGCGFGGYCLPKDTMAMVGRAREHGLEAPLLDSVLKVNAEIKPYLIGRLTREVPANSKIGVLGLSFKPESDDVRQSPAVEVIKLLLEAGYRVVGHDPIAVDNFSSTYDLDIEYEHSFEKICEELDYFVIATAWPTFASNKKLFDGKSVYDFRYLL